MPHDSDHPTGNFDAVILDHGYNQAKTGTTQFWVKFETEVDQIIGYFPLTDKAADGTLRKIQAMGYVGTNLSELADGSALRGHNCVITVGSDEWQGVRRSKVEWVNPEGWVPGVQRDETAAENASRFNGLLAKIQADKAGTKGGLPF